MSAAPPRLILVDPCLDGPGSHPWQYAVALLGAARRRGWGCDLVCRSSAELPAAALLGWRVWPVLRFPGASKLTAFAELDRLAPDGRARWQPPWAAWVRRRRRRERVAAFATDLAPVVADLAPGDQLLVATASELDALGLAQAIDAARPPQGIGWHLQFHSPLLPPPPAEPDLTTSRIARVGRCLDEAIRRAVPHRLRFHAPTRELAAEWSQVGAERSLPRRSARRRTQREKLPSHPRAPRADRRDPGLRRPAAVRHPDQPRLQPPFAPSGRYPRCRGTRGARAPR